MAKSFFTYKTIPQDAFDIFWYVDGRERKNGTEIKTWKKNASLKITIEIDISLKLLNESISPNAEIEFIVNYYSPFKQGGTGLRGKVYSSIYKRNTFDANMNVEINCEIPGDKIAGTLELSFLACVSKNVTNDISVYATKSGSILYEEGIVLYLEGNQALFPVKAIDFNKDNKVFPKSLYYLSKKYGDLSSNFNSSYKLYINTTHLLFDKINDDNHFEDANQYVLKMIMYDIYRTILTDALDSENGLNEGDLSETDVDNYSLRSVYLRIVKQILEYFPNNNFNQLQEMFNGDELSRNKVLAALQDFILN